MSMLIKSSDNLNLREITQPTRMSIHANHFHTQSKKKKTTQCIKQLNPCLLKQNIQIKKKLKKGKMKKDNRKAWEDVTTESSLCYVAYCTSIQTRVP
jgi:hypothetical protein